MREEPEAVKIARAWIDGTSWCSRDPLAKAVIILWDLVCQLEAASKRHSAENVELAGDIVEEAVRPIIAERDSLRAQLAATQAALVEACRIASNALGHSTYSDDKELQLHERIAELRKLGGEQ